MKKILVHICCAPCIMHPLDILKGSFDEVTGYFYNPNISSEDEYKMRLDELKRVSLELNLHIIEGAYNNKNWEEKIAGYEKGPEGGSRCRLCYKMRLENTANMAKKIGAGFFTTVLSISPHKDSDMINGIGRDIASNTGTTFFEANFKAGNGFKIGVEKGKQYNLIRQNYCGCVFSKKDKRSHKDTKTQRGTIKKETLSL